MSLHDEYARLTPYEIAFEGGLDVAELADRIESEASTRGLEALEFPAFLSLEAVSTALGDLADPDEPASTRHRQASLLFHAVHFHAAGRPLYLLTTELVRHLITHTPSGAPDPPQPAGYVQLPRHLFWTPGSEGAPESADGVFWVLSPSGSLHTLLVTGLRPDRPGFGTVALPEAPVSHADRWLDAQVREAGRDYASTLAGGELDELYSLDAAGEVLKLLARVFAYVADAGSTPRLPADDSGPGNPVPSSLAFEHVQLVMP